MTDQLVSGDDMPSLFGKDADGNEVDMVASVAGHWAVLQLYRGHW